MWIALLLLSWCVEGVVGIWFCAHYWLFTQFRYDGNATVLGPGYAIVRIYNGFISTWDQAYHLHRHPLVLTQSRLALLLVALYVALHALALARGLVAPIENGASSGFGGSRVAGKSSGSSRCMRAWRERRQRYRMRRPSNGPGGGGCVTTTRGCRCVLSASYW